MTHLRSRTIALTSSVFFLLPLSALAHEHRVFTIGDHKYAISIGSINEPVRVDDKSGVEIAVEDLSIPQIIQQLPLEDGDDEPPGSPVGGLESTLKVEVIAGDKKKVFDLVPVWSEIGSYRAVFFPTVQTSYTYRLFGTINNVAVDLSFPCAPAGHAKAAEDTTSVQLSPGVTQTLKSGAFGCPGPKADVQFPETSATTVELQSRVLAVESSPTLGIAILGLLAGLIGMALGTAALIKSKR